MIHLGTQVPSFFIWRPLITVLESFLGLVEIVMSWFLMYEISMG